MAKPVYLDCAATTPIEAEVVRLVTRFLVEEYGNAGSRTHEFGAKAKQAVQKARDQIANVVRCDREEVVFTSGATESNNLAVLGLAEFGERERRRHIVSTSIEHKAVLEPLGEMTRRGFEVDYVMPDARGRVHVHEIVAKVRADTLLVSMMHANNETGVIQPIEELAAALQSHPAFLHVDAAQSFGKVFSPLQNKRVDLISASAHKIFGPKGVGALITRRRGYEKLPLKPLTFGGGQERGLRPGTLPVPLIVGFGAAAELALKAHPARQKRCEVFRSELETALRPLGLQVHGDSSPRLPHIVNFSLPGFDSEAVMVAIKDEIAVSNGSACTSASYTPSHVLKAMALTDAEIAGALRLSWCHLTPDVDWSSVVKKLQALRGISP